MFAHCASLVGNPTSKRTETATAYTGGRWQQLKKMIRKKLYILIFDLALIINFSVFQVKSQNLEYESVYKNLSPNQFLNYLTKFNKNVLFVTCFKAPIEWITIKDIDTLISRAYDTTSIPSIVHPLSSFIPNEKSCVGREAQNMIEAFMNQKSYVDFLYSYGKVDSISAKKLINWYHQRN